ncbi:hypothetical protein ACIOHO_23380 [Streptomyces sp. NPDC087849]|uniref:hypothetical protein n=1 Tax=Streptomyces sp. NPDC087849 TaxID=3365808 RepID=UPI0037F51751
MGARDDTPRGPMARVKAVVAAYVRACTVPDAHATSPLAPVPCAALAAFRTDVPGTYPGTPERCADVTSTGA